jgi:hypothetical protein
MECVGQVPICIFSSVVSLNLKSQFSLLVLMMVARHLNIDESVWLKCGNSRNPFPTRRRGRGRGGGEGLRDKKPEQVCNLSPITHKNRNLEHPFPSDFHLNCSLHRFFSVLSRFGWSPPPPPTTTWDPTIVPSPAINQGNSREFYSFLLRRMNG